MSARPVKRSLTLQGHRTSVSLEEPFWQAFREIAREEGRALNALAAEIDAARDPEPGWPRRSGCMCCAFPGAGGVKPSSPGAACRFQDESHRTRLKAG